MLAIRHLTTLILFLTVGLSACQPSSEVATTPEAESASPSPTITLDSPTPSATAPQTAETVFSPILPQLKAQTQIPLRLPTYLPSLEEPNPTYAIVETASPTEYRVLLAFTPDCTGGTACRIGETSAIALTPESPALTGESVALDNNITGYFVDAVCEANCSDSTLTWEQAGNRYTVAIKAGKVETLTQMANSAIAANLR